MQISRIRAGALASLLVPASFLVASTVHAGTYGSHSSATALINDPGSSLTVSEPSGAHNGSFLVATLVVNAQFCQ